jgi:hypothetical protein
VDISRAFGYSFEDEEWLPKLGILAGITWLSYLFTIVLIGFIGIAAMLGYLVELVANVRDGHPRPLPRWDNYGSKISKGGSVLVAGFVYSLPNILLGCCVGLIPNLFQSRDTSSVISLGLFCCITPLFLIYNLITWPMLALGLARYAEEGIIGVFFQFGDLFGAMRRNTNATIQWIILSFIVNLILSVVGLIPCIGWVAVPALAIPVHGYLIAQYADLIEEKPKRKPKYA